MPWTATQKQIAVRACKQAGISDEQRREMILRNFVNAHDKGAVSSTSPRLNNRDFACFMEIVETQAGGKVLHFERGYWRQQAQDTYSQMRFYTQQIANQLEAAGRLAADGAGLRGWIRARVSKGETDQIQQLDYHGLLALITGLLAFAHQRGVEIAHEKADQDAGK